MTASNVATPKIPTTEARPAPEKVSDQIALWLASDGDKTLGGLIDMFQEKSFALIFILLLGVPALPLPTGGATHVFEIIATLVAFQLVAGRDKSGCLSAGARSSSGPAAVGRASSEPDEGHP